MAIEFTVDHDHTYASSIGFEQLIGWITASVGTLPGDFRVREVGAGLARTINLPPRKGYLHSDGHVYRDQTLGEPFRLVANDPAFNLQHLTYRVDFEFTTLAGDSVAVPPAFFSAPSSDTILQLTKVMTDPYQPVMEVRAKVYTEDILDAGGFGQEVVFTGSASDFWELAGEVPSANLPSYVDDILEFDNYAAFPVAEEAETGKIYVALDSNASYRWSGSQYVHAGNPTSFPNDSGFATVVNRASVIDLRDYLTGANTFDVAAVVAAMESSGKACFIPPGNWQPDAFNVPLDDTAIATTAPNQTSDFLYTYTFIGAGKQSCIVLPAGMTSADYVFVPNSTDSATFAAWPKIRCEKFSVTGQRTGFTSSPDGSFMKPNQRSISASDVTFSDMLNGFYATGYSDLCHLERVFGFNMTAGGWLFKGEELGDGLVFDQVGSYVGGSVSLYGAKGASIRGGLNGFYQFFHSDVSMQDAHIESYAVSGSGDPNPSTAAIYIRNSTVELISGSFYPLASRSFIEINDASLPAGGGGSKLVVREGVRWIQRLDDVGSTIGAVTGPHIDVLAGGTQTTIRLERSQVGNFGQRAGGAGGWYGRSLAPRVTASGDSALQTLLNDVKTQAVLGGDCTISRPTASTWAVNGPVIQLSQSAAPSLAVTAVADSVFTTSVASGEFFYRCYVVDASGRWSAASAEVSVTTSTPTPLARLEIATNRAPCALRILRGTTTGTYTHWVQLPVSSAALLLTDQGAAIAGYAWSTSSVPSWSATSGMVDGIFYPGAGRTVCFAASEPAAGTFAEGDLCFATTSAGGSIGWVYTSGSAWAPMLTGRTVTSPRIDQIYDTSSQLLINFIPTGGDCYLNVANAASGGTVTLSVGGADGSLLVIPKGADSSFRVRGQSGAPSILQASNPDTDGAWEYRAKGAAGHKFTTASGASLAAVELGSIELGHASDTTLSRSAAGKLAIEGIDVLLAGGALGTPSSGNLADATGYKVGALADSVGGKRFLSTFGESPVMGAIALSTIGGSIVPTAANGGLFMQLIPRTNLAVTSLLWQVSAGSGDYDIAILDSAGNRLWSKGSTAVPAAGTLVAETVTGVNLTAGLAYYVGFSSSDGTAGVKGLGGTNCGDIARLVDGTPSVLSVGSVFPIPSTVTLGSTTANRLPFIALRGTAS